MTSIPSAEQHHHQLVLDAIILLVPLLQDHREITTHLRAFFNDYCDSTEDQRRSQIRVYITLFRELNALIEKEIMYCIGRQHSLRQRGDVRYLQLMVHLSGMRAAKSIMRMIGIAEQWYIEGYNIQSRYRRVLKYCLRIRELLGITTED